MTADELADLRPVVVDEDLARRIVVRAASGEITILVPVGIGPADALQALQRAAQAVQFISVEGDSDVHP